MTTPKQQRARAEFERQGWKFAPAEVAQSLRANPEGLTRPQREAFDAGQASMDAEFESGFAAVMLICPHGLWATYRPLRKAETAVDLFSAFDPCPVRLSHSHWRPAGLALPTFIAAGSHDPENQGTGERIGRVFTSAVAEFMRRVGSPADDGCDPDLYIDLRTDTGQLTVSYGHEKWCPRYATGDVPGMGGVEYAAVDRLGGIHRAGWRPVAVH